MKCPLVSSAHHLIGAFFRPRLGGIPAHRRRTANALWLSALLAFPIAAAPAIEVTAETVRVAGVSPGANVVLFGLTRHPLEFESRVSRVTNLVRDEDADGVVEVTTPVPLKSVWFAVDLATGAHATATPSEFRLRELPVRALLRSHLAAGRTSLDPERELFDMVVVRPGGGAWHQTVGDGGRYDGDGRPNGRAAVSLTRLAPIVEGTPPPEALASGDVVFIVDAHTMQAVATTIR
ncbi:MAG: hypothetical protein ACRD2J_06695 [Thermoanaerobaculia bacterium]